MRTPAPAGYDLALILALSLISIVGISLVIRSTFIGDRIVLGPITVAICLSVVIRVALPNEQTVDILRAVAWSVWLIFLVAGIVVLLRQHTGALNGDLV